MVLTEGLTALSSIKSLSDFAREIRDSSDPEKLRAVASAVLDLAITARAKTALLQEERNAAVIELAALKAEIEKAKRFDDEAKNYTREITHTGATVYRKKDAGGQEGQSPYYCPNCFANKKFAILNPAPGENTRIGVCVYMCPCCQTGTALNRLYPRN